MTDDRKITLGEMRSAGVRGILIYCRDHKCSHHVAILADQSPMMSGRPISSRISSAPRAANMVAKSGRISIGAANRLPPWDIAKGVNGLPAAGGLFVYRRL
jgi:hypothetical protein